MDVFVRQVPQHATSKQLKEFFAAPLGEFGIKVYACEKFTNKRLAKLTILEDHLGRLFLQEYGLPQNANPRARPKKSLRMFTDFLLCAESRDEPSDLLLRSLAMEQAQLASKATSSSLTHKHGPKQDVTTFQISELRCGVWEYQKRQLVFVPHYENFTGGKIVFGQKRAVLLLHTTGSQSTRIDIDYCSVDHVVSGSYQDPSISLTLDVPPKIYKVVEETDLVEAMRLMGIDSAKTKIKKNRTTSIDSAHAGIAGTCLVYRLHLADYATISTVYELLRRFPKISSPVNFQTNVARPVETLRKSFARLNIELTDIARYGKLPFQVLFHLERLAWNAKLSPRIVLKLLPMVDQIVTDIGVQAAAHAVRSLCRSLPVPGPHTESRDFEPAKLTSSLQQYAASYDQFGTDSAFNLTKKHSHIVLIHKIIITPMGTYLEGPEPEVTNRVLRKFPDHTDNFIRVTFTNEYGEPVRFDSQADQHDIFHERFKAVLDGTILVAGRGFAFLGFSHSSLRSQNCWFMAPFTANGENMHAPIVIKQLGDFSQIFSPAKCAARIGQTFTDTSKTVEIGPQDVKVIAEVERYGRVFSDGVGTISKGLLTRIWRVYQPKRTLKPTLLQIRFAGAKGMVSLDSRLPGDCLMLRGSMVKFSGSDAWEVEVCGAAFRPLPMILNRQFIKIFEDLGIEDQKLVELQETAVNRLRCLTTSNINAATFLENECFVSKAAQMPSLIKLLEDLGMDFHEDDFLRQVVKMAVVTKLRDIKYRGRIPVSNGVTLYGIMDETGFLKEGEVYVVTEQPPEGGKHVLTGRVVVTRSPAMHPGDIQVVRAVDVPSDSPLNALSNCVVFSQHGSRDLPSQLSGGDLDGDLYNVIYDPGLLPKVTYPAADYPRVEPIDIGRQVTAKDMTDFFVTFMETDQLGNICNIHQQLADQMAIGTLHKDCIKLAGMASTAVDYSKTGIPVKMSECPKYKRLKPDFMARSPRVAVDHHGFLEAVDDAEDDEDDAVTAMDPDSKPMRYYESHKILGKLYRAIDEQQFLQSMRSRHNLVKTQETSRLMSRLWDYVQRQNVLVQWTHYKPLARRIKESFEHNVRDALYDYSPVLHQPITEHEIFAGTILGRQAGAQNKTLRETCTKMREIFEEIVQFPTYRILHGDTEQDTDDRDQEALPRAIACFAVGMEESSLYDRNVGELESWRYLAAGVCLREMERWRQSTGLYGPLPRD